MTDKQQLERVAKAIFADWHEVLLRIDPKLKDSVWDNTKESWLAQAQAAINAMPTVNALMQTIESQKQTHDALISRERELRKIVINYREALQAFANDGDIQFKIAFDKAEQELDQALSKGGE